MAGSTNEKVARILAAVDADALIGQIVQSLPREVAAHTRMSDDLGAKVVPIVREVLKAGMAALATGSDVPRDVLARMTESARGRGSEGMPLEDVLKGYRVASRVSWRAIRQAAGPGDEDALVLAAERLMAFQDVAILNVTRAYLAERHQLVSEQERWARHLFDALVERVEPTANDREIARSLHLTFGDPLLPFVFGLKENTAQAHGVGAEDLRSKGVLAVSEGDRVIGLVLAGDTPPVLPEPHVMSVGAPAEPGHVARTLTILRAAVTAGRQEGRSGLVTIGEVGPHVLLELCPDVADALVLSIFGPLSRELARTLAVLVECDFDRTATAKALHVHRNTIVYRLRQIESLIHRDLGASRDLTAITLAHHARGLRPNQTVRRC